MQHAFERTDGAVATAMLQAASLLGCAGEIRVLAPSMFGARVVALQAHTSGTCTPVTYISTRDTTGVTASFETAVMQGMARLV